MIVRIGSFQPSLIATLAAALVGCAPRKEADEQHVAEESTEEPTTHGSSPTDEHTRSSGDVGGTPSGVTDGAGSETSAHPSSTSRDTPSDQPSASSNPQGSSTTFDASTSLAHGPYGALDPRCPQSLKVPFPDTPQAPPCTEPGLVCEYELHCSSGLQTLLVSCLDGVWSGPTGCDNPYDFCPSVMPFVDGEPPVYCTEKGIWDIETSLVNASTGRGVCPAEAPAPGDECYVAGGTGGGPSREPCGYPCPNAPDAWTVFTCDNPGVVGPSNEGLKGHWVSDGACE